MGSALSKKDKKNLVILSAGLLALGVVAYQVSSKSSQTGSSKDLGNSSSFQEKKHVPQNDQVKQDQSDYNQLFQQTLREITIQKENNFLSLLTITQILEKSLNLVKSEYIELTERNRRERRQIRISDPQQYQQMILMYNEEIENLMEKKQIELCKALNITEEQFQESAMNIMERGFFQQFFMIQASIRQKVKEFIPSKKNLNKEQLQNIIKYQLEVLQKKPKDLTSMIQKLSENQETQQLIPLAVNTILADYVYEKFQIEEEDMIRMMQDQSNFTDQTMQQLMQQLEQNMYDLLQGYGGM